MTHDVRQYGTDTTDEAWDALHEMCGRFINPKWQPCDVMPFPTRPMWPDVAERFLVLVAHDEQGAPTGVMAFRTTDSATEDRPIGDLAYGAVDLTLSPFNGTGDEMWPGHAEILGAIWTEATAILGVTPVARPVNERLAAEWTKVEGA